MNLDDYLNKAVKRACLLVEREAKKNVPVDTGNLRNSITFETKSRYGEVFTNEEYAPYVEYGTGLFAEDGNGRQTPWSYQTADGEWHTTAGQTPQPFLRPALEDNQDEIIKLFAEEIANYVISETKGS